MTTSDRVSRLLALIDTPRQPPDRYAGSLHTIYSAALAVGYTRSNISGAYAAVARAELAKLREAHKVAIG